MWNWFIASRINSTLGTLITTARASSSTARATCTLAIGDRGQRPLAQSVKWPHGKIHRLHDDGGVPSDNPFIRRDGAIASIWSYGHRNPQGMALHPETDQLWAAEHGPKGGDELNHVRRGLNYGWPVITYGLNYDGTPITDQTHAEGMEQPQTYWVTSIAVCGIDFYTGEQFGNWQNDLLVTSLRFNRLHRLRLKDTEVVRDEIVYQGQSRMRDVQTGPDGADLSRGGRSGANFAAGADGIETVRRRQASRAAASGPPILLIDSNLFEKVPHLLLVLVLVF